MLPKRLNVSPIVNALFELRFRPASPAVADLLPGLFYSEFKGRYADVAPLPVASIPREIREKDPNLRYQAHHQLSSAEGDLQIGQRVMALSYGTSYPGWINFKNSVLELLTVLRKTDLIADVERFSFRYINLFSAAPGKQLELLNGTWEIRGEPVPEQGFQFRTEFINADGFTIVQIHTNAEAILPSGEKRGGLLVDVDTILRVSGARFWTSQEELLEGAHDTLKGQFFALMTDAAISRMDPVYE